MANPVIINPSLTLAGQAAAFNASNTGIELKLTHVSFGRAHYDPTGAEIALVNPVGSKIPIAGGSRPTPYQLRMSCAWSENVGDVPIGEIAWWAGNTLVFVWSKANGEIASYKTDGVTYVLFNDLAFASVPANSISFVIDPNESVALAALTAHEGASNAHPQYLMREHVAEDVGPLSFLNSTGSGANVLILKLQSNESKVAALGLGQRFQFLAQLANTGPVTAKIEAFPQIAVKRGGDAGLVDLEAGDIKAGSLYDLNYDGTFFQLGGGVGSGKAFERFSFTASVGQSEFTFAHSPGSVIALRNGREVRDFTSATNGTKVTMAIPCNLDDSLEFLAFKSFRVADSYTKAEITALLATAGAVPVGTMLPFPMGIVPPGYLEVDNGLFQDTLYPDLAAYLAKKYNVAGDPVGYTRKPESRGEFFRGWDHGRGVDPGRDIGTYQGDLTKAHNHGMLVDSGVNAVFGALGYKNTGGGLIGGVARSTTTYTDSSVGAETRPRSLSVMWCIKAWSVPVNQGTIDIAALALQVTQLKSTLASLFKKITNVTTSRVIGTTYTNDTGLPLFVNLSLVSGLTNQTAVMHIDGVSVYGSSYPSVGSSLALSAIVPPGATYRVPPDTYTLIAWTETR